MTSQTRQRPSTALLAMRLFGKLPLALSARLAAGLAWLSAWLPLGMAGAYRNALINIMLSHPHLNWGQASRLARRALAGSARNLADAAHVWSASPEENLSRISRIEGLQAVREAHAAGRPLLILTLHHSSWELPSLLLGRELPATIFYNPHDDAQLTRAVTAAREATGSRLVEANARGIKAGLRALERKEAVVIVADHLPKGRNNPYVPFFGVPVRSSSLPHQLIRRFDPAVFFMYSHRPGNDGRVEIHFEAADTALHDPDPQTGLTALSVGLARIIERAPAQYHWTNKRYARTAHGPRTLYRRGSVKALRRARRENRCARLEELGRH
ncbi:lysophospholipid acyltransferase family protein [Alkalilimnicola sp. S0819]|uniref:lysophospholipid acyltransferase family protein n=1 Tax=Alkalilimnicola sp. S0819 TaxID=2613922 RepID=UPI0012623834|nr:lipid A biosynthesis acyltransferase [Alkalilimnicola sp. S0819]KAB7619755.1 lipid A biosynthesis acyltransferase [Alkalilimnicola sp. S0819]MPQ17519.1 lipid A biosynthesis acyltransferase [Alkalilimnicola sp. S0819]